jgi:hypothetical protein
MAGLALYARSRGFAVAALATLVAAAGYYVPGKLWWHGQVGPQSMMFVLTLGVVAASVGLVGADVALDRTASFGWPPRRAVHLVGLAAFVGAAGLAVDALLGSPVAAGVVLRDAAGQAGLAGIGVVVLGGTLGWLLPLAAVVLAMLPAGQAASWLAQDAGNTPAAVVAAVAGGAGLVAYAVLGCRRA